MQRYREVTGLEFDHSKRYVPRHRGYVAGLLRDIAVFRGAMKHCSGIDIKRIAKRNLRDARSFRLNHQVVGWLP